MFWREIGLAFGVEVNKNIQNHLAWRKKRLSCPIKNHNLDGLFNKVQGWSKYGKCPFVNLKVKDELWEETYLATLLSCWLYTFVLPSEDLKTIRLGTFKIAGFMAAGCPVSLAIPVLASLYRGLNKIAHFSPTISHSGAWFKRYDKLMKRR